MENCTEEKLISVQFASIEAGLVASEAFNELTFIKPLPRSRTLQEERWNQRLLCNESVLNSKTNPNSNRNRKQKRKPTRNEKQISHFRQLGLRRHKTTKPYFLFASVLNWFLLVLALQLIITHSNEHSEATSTVSQPFPAVSGNFFCRYKQNWLKKQQPSLLTSSSSSLR